jgi:site-specific DNA recombinase
MRRKDEKDRSEGEAGARKKAAAVYCRVSTPAQGKADKISIGEQERLCREIAERVGLVVAQVYIDAGISGTLWEEREAMQRLVADAETGRFSELICYEQDRLARANEGFSKLASLLRDQGILLRTPGGIVDLADPDGELLFTIKGALSTAENQKRALRTRDMKAAYAQQGRWAESTKLFGYSWSRELKRPVVNPDEARTVEVIFRMAAEERESCEQIAKHLNAAGIRAKGGGCNGDGHWYGAVISRSLAEPRYMGAKWETAPGVEVSPACAPCRLVMEPATDQEGKPLLDDAGNPILRPKRDAADRLVTEPAPALVSAALWHKAQQTAEIYRATRSPFVRRPRLLNHMARCGKCGSPMSTRATTSRGNLYAYYYCLKSDHTPRGSKCDLPHVPADRLDDTVWAEVLRWAADPEVVREIARETKEQNFSEWRQELQAVYAELKGLRMRLGRARVAYEKGSYTLEDYEEAQGRASEEEAILEQQQAHLTALAEGEEARLAGVDSTIAALEQAGDLDSLPLADKRRFLADLQARVIVFNRDHYRLEWLGVALGQVGVAPHGRVRPM